MLHLPLKNKKSDFFLFVLLNLTPISTSFRFLSLNHKKLGHSVAESRDFFSLYCQAKNYTKKQFSFAKRMSGHKLVIKDALWQLAGRVISALFGFVITKIIASYL